MHLLHAGHGVLGLARPAPDPHRYAAPPERGERRLVGGVVSRVDDDRRTRSEGGPDAIDDPARGRALAPPDVGDEVEDGAARNHPEVGHALRDMRREGPRLVPSRRSDPPVVEAHREPLELDVRAGYRRRAPRKRAARGGDPRDAGARVAEAQAAALDLEAVAAAIDDAVEADARPNVPERPARQDGEPGPLAGGEPREGRPNRDGQYRSAWPCDDRCQRPVVVEDREEAGAAIELALQALEEAGREAQEALTAGSSSGIRVSSLSNNPAQR